MPNMLNRVFIVDSENSFFTANIRQLLFKIKQVSVLLENYLCKKMFEHHE